MNDYGSWAKGSRCYKQLRVIDDMYDSESSTQGFRCYEYLRIMDDMSYFVLWAQGFGCYDQLKVMDDKNNSGSHELRPLDAMTSSGL